MKQVRITAIRKVSHTDLISQYENPILHPCDISEGGQWISVDGAMPPSFCPEAWKSLQPFVAELAAGGGNFFNGWMKNPHSAMVSCNDGFRPVSFLVETID